MALELIASALALKAGGVALTRARARAREQAAEAAYPPEGRFVEVEGRQVHALTRGEGPDLVLIHGAGGSLRDFSFGLIDRLASQFRVTAFDRPGFGWSDPVRGAERLEVQARHLRAAARALGLSDRPLVLGQSYGGAVALAWALQAAPAGLVLVSAPTHPWPGGLPALYRLTAPPLGQALAVPLLIAFTPRRVVTQQLDSVFHPQPMPQGYDSHFGPAMTLRRRTLRLNARQRAALKPQMAEMARHYAAITCPVEVIHGTEDRIVWLDIHARRFAAETPQARLTELPGIGHMPHHAAPEAVQDACRRAAARAGLHLPAQSPYLPDTQGDTP